MHFALVLSTPTGPRSLAICSVPDLSENDVRLVTTHMRLPSIAPDPRVRTEYTLEIQAEPQAAHLPLLGIVAAGGRVRSRTSKGMTYSPEELEHTLYNAIRAFLDSIEAERAKRASDLAGSLHALGNVVTETRAELQAVKLRAGTVAADLRALCKDQIVSDIWGKLTITAARLDNIHLTGEDDFGRVGDYWGVTLTAQQYAEIVLFCCRDQKINAIKAARNASATLGLKEAKDWVEGHWDALRSSPPAPIAT